MYNSISQIAISRDTRQIALQARLPETDEARRSIARGQNVRRERVLIRAVPTERREDSPRDAPG